MVTFKVFVFCFNDVGLPNIDRNQTCFWPHPMQLKKKIQSRPTILPSWVFRLSKIQWYDAMGSITIANCLIFTYCKNVKQIKQSCKYMWKRNIVYIELFTKLYNFLVLNIIMQNVQNLNCFP